MDGFGQTIGDRPTPGVGQRPLPLEDADAAIAGHPPASYIRRSRSAILLGALLKIGVILLNLSALFGWLAAALLPALLASFLLLRRRFSIAATVTAGAFTGFGIGLLTALFELAWYRQLWTVFNLVAEPFLGLLVGLVSAGFTWILLVRFTSPRGR